MRTRIVLGLLCTLPSAAMAAELVTNGDFEGGNIGFTSDYTYVTPGTSVGFPNGNLYPADTYTVDTNPRTSHDLFTSMGDHTTGSGNMMILNGAADDGMNVWSETFAVTANTNYNISVWIATVYPQSPANLSIRMNGLDVIGSPVSPGIVDGTWTQFTSVWNSGAATSASFGIYDLNTEPNGNDFALDDLSVQAVPEPASMAVLGLGALALVRRKRRNSA